MLVITHKSSDWVVYMCVFMPQYIILLSLICFTNSQNNQVKKKMVHGNCDICKVVNLYYTLNIIYIGIILFIVKPLSFAYCNVPACDKNTEYLIVPPFFAVTCVYLGRSIPMMRHNKSPASDQKIFLV
ncbi:hypothetical protein SNE40_007785 [Patella caerulea]|uniref:Uncharacterized protein n=1 Tax=Patella caerulea TaxID=87958 RepID=A0AAN8K4A6_PATCE